MRAKTKRPKPVKRRRARPRDVAAEMAAGISKIAVLLEFLEAKAAYLSAIRAELTELNDHTRMLDITIPRGLSRVSWDVGLISQRLGDLRERRTWWDGLLVRFQIWRANRRTKKGDGNATAAELAQKFHGDSEPSAWKPNP